VLGGRIVDLFRMPLEQLDSTVISSGSRDVLTIMLGILRRGGLCLTSRFPVYCHIIITVPAPASPRRSVFRRQLVGRDHHPPTHVRRRTSAIVSNLMES